MKALTPILIIPMICAGCTARKIITIPAKAAVKTTVKTSGKMTVGATKAVIPNGDKSK